MMLASPLPLSEPHTVPGPMPLTACASALSEELSSLVLPALTAR